MFDLIVFHLMFCNGVSFGVLNPCFLQVEEFEQNQKPSCGWLQPPSAEVPSMGCFARRSAFVLAVTVLDYV